MSRDFDIEAAAFDDLPLVFPPPPRTEEQTMSGDAKCSMGCGRSLGAANKTGVCTPCQRPNRAAASPGAVRKPRASREAPALIEKPFDASADVAEPATAAPTEPERPWTKRFFELMPALGQDPVEMLENFCMEYVQSTVARALGHSTKPPPTELKLLPSEATTGT